MAAILSSPEVLRDLVTPAMANKLLADCTVYASANGLANLAINRDKVGQFVKGSRVMYKGWLHGYERAAAVTGSKLLTIAAQGAKTTLGPSVVYGCTMNVAACALGLPSLVAVGGANVVTPVIVSKLGGSLTKFSTTALAARAFPIAAHCVIEWGLYAKIKEHLESRNVHTATAVPRTRMSMVMEGALIGGVCAAAATATTVFALSPWYGGKLLSRAFAADSAAATAKLSMAAVRVTGIRLADSLQQGVVWFSTYEGMRAAMAIYDKKVAQEAAAEEQKEASVMPPYTLSVSAVIAAAEERASEIHDAVSSLDSADGPGSPRSPRFSLPSRKMSSPRVSMTRSSSTDFSPQSPRRFNLAGC